MRRKRARILIEQREKLKSKILGSMEEALLRKQQS
jgi:hypothetical protein